jgi:hypothetical protein
MHKSKTKKYNHKNYKSKKCNPKKCKTKKCKTKSKKSKSKKYTNLAKSGKKTKKNYFMKGGNYSTRQLECLNEILITYGFDDTNISLMRNAFNVTSQIYPFVQFVHQIVDYRFLEDYASAERGEINLTGITQDEINEGMNAAFRLYLVTLRIISELQEGDTDTESDSDSDSDFDSDFESDN